MPQPAEDPARAERVADALIDAVLQRGVVVIAERFEPADLDHHHDEIRVGDGLAAVGRRPDFGGELVVLDHPPDKRFHPPKLGFRRRHQREFRIPQRRRREDVADERLAEDDAAGSDHGDFLGHGMALPKMSARVTKTDGHYTVHA
jgi:hypothetical protein